MCTFLGLLLFAFDSYLREYHKNDTPLFYLLEPIVFIGFALLCNKAAKHKMIGAAVALLSLIPAIQMNTQPPFTMSVYVGEWLVTHTPLLTTSYAFLWYLCRIKSRPHTFLKCLYGACTICIAMLLLDWLRGDTKYSLFKSAMSAFVFIGAGVYYGIIQALAFKRYLSTKIRLNLANRKARRIG